MCSDDEQEVAYADSAVAGEGVHSDLGECGGEETADKGPGPELHRGEDTAPFTSVVTETDLEGEVNEDRECHVFLREAFVEELKVGYGVVGLEADFGDEVDDDEGLDICRGAVSGVGGWGARGDGRLSFITRHMVE